MTFFSDLLAWIRWQLDGPDKSYLALHKKWREKSLECNRLQKSITRLRQENTILEDHNHALYKSLGEASQGLNMAIRSIKSLNAEIDLLKGELGL